METWNGTSVCIVYGRLPLQGEGDRMETFVRYALDASTTFILPLQGEGDRMETLPPKSAFCSLTMLSNLPLQGEGDRMETPPNTWILAKAQTGEA